MHEIPDKNIEKNTEECISEESFNEQFSEDILLSKERGEVTYSKVTPETLKYDKPVTYIGGFSQGKETYVDELRNLCESGHEVVFANPIKGFDVSESDSYAEFQAKYDLPDVVLSEVAALEEIIRQEEFLQTELVGHSQGGITAALLAKKYPTLADDLVLVSPAGFNPGESTLQLAKNFSSQLAGNVTRNKSSELKSSMKRAGKAFFSEATRSEEKDSLLQTILWRLRVEVPGFAAVDLAPILKDLRERDNSTKVTLLTANKDELFKPEMYEAKLGDEVFEYIDAWASFVDRDASHTAAGIELPGLLRQVLDQ